MLLNKKTIMLIVDLTYAFTGGITIPYLSYFLLCSDGCFLLLNSMQYFKVKCWKFFLSTDTSTKKRLPHTNTLDGLSLRNV